MQATLDSRPSRRTTTLLGTALLLATTAGVAWLTRRDSVTADSVLAAAWVGAIGTVAMTLLTARHAGYPRWAYVGAAAIMSVGILISTATARSPVEWVNEVRPLIWMYPWTILTMGLVLPAPRTGWCAAHQRWAPWILIGTGFLLGVITIVTPRISQLF